MYQDIQEFAIRNQEQILIGIGSFLGWVVLLWSKNKAVKWYNGPELHISKEVEEILKILQEKRQEIITCEQIILAQNTLNWPKTLYVEVDKSGRYDRLEILSNPRSKINMNRKEKRILETLLLELYEERANFNKETALQNMKYAQVLNEQEPDPDPYYSREFQVGDVVALKSGSPPMTVYKQDEKEGRPVVHCESYIENKDKSWKDTWHYEDVLEKYVKPTTKPPGNYTVADMVKLQEACEKGWRDLKNNIVKPSQTSPIQLPQEKLGCGPLNREQWDKIRKAASGKLNIMDIEYPGEYYNGLSGSGSSCYLTICMHLDGNGLWASDMEKMKREHGFTYITFEEAIEAIEKMPKKP